MKPDYLSSPTIWALALGSCVLTLALIPVVMKFARLLGVVDREGHRCVYKGNGMPLLGGLTIGLPFVGVCVLGVLGVGNMFGTIGRHREGMLAMACGCSGILLLGAIDDFKGLTARAKLVGQFMMASLPCLAGYTIRGLELPFYGALHFGPAVGTVVTLLWVVGLTNAYNLIDGIDGLATGLALIAAVGLGLISFLNGSTFPALMCVALAGSLTTFLAFNFHPARIFLGDTGSLFLGYALANITLMGSLKTTGAVIFLAPILVLGLPILDTLFSIARRYLRGRPLFKGDQGHLHHRMLRRGYSQRKSALILYGIAMIMTVSAVAGWSLPENSPLAWATAGCYGFAVMALLRIADLRPSGLPQMIKSHRRNVLLHSLSRYASMRLNDDLSATSLSDKKVLEFICRELCLKQLVVENENGERLLSCNPGDGAGRDHSTPPLWRVKVRIANKRFVQLSIQPGRPCDETARADIEDCLAGILERKTFSTLGKTVPITLPVQAVRDEKPNLRLSDAG